jgi:hypothetical protein
VPIRLLLLAAVSACVAAADAGGGRRAGIADDSSAQAARGARIPPPPAPRDTVDSLYAARHATVLDRRKLPPLPPPPPKKAADSATAATPDTTPPRRPPPLLGPRSGNRHPAFRDAGSPLDSLWPVKGPAPLPGSILPAKRIVAFYGNPLSKGMGILGAYEPEEMLRKLDAEAAAWNRIDPAHPVKPALHVIALVANPHPGPNGLYRTRHDSAMIERVYGWAKSRDALLFVDLQVGRSTLEHELPWIEKFLVRPDVHLGIDP